MYHVKIYDLRLPFGDPVSPTATRARSIAFAEGRRETGGRGGRGGACGRTFAVEDERAEYLTDGTHEPLTEITAFSDHLTSALDVIMKMHHTVALYS
ncbi:hypothetical protein EVAR_30994_1 [Eumeta japonica]|uniref:Uncharacterized protein n=1 Tax=Eumeta variegata TaxID=151549 RepID=A0A4C1W8X9_EUMVA|nr:hypothetical protein EVAR_30994_1 [Eumeta japonica]